MAKKRVKKVVELPPGSSDNEDKGRVSTPLPAVPRRGGKRVTIAAGTNALETQGRKANTKALRKTSQDKVIDDEIAAAASDAQIDGDEKSEADVAHAKPPKTKDKYALAMDYLSLSELTNQYTFVYSVQ
jgi:hypothetical protein